MEQLKSRARVLLFGVLVLNASIFLCSIIVLALRLKLLFLIGLIVSVILSIALFIIFGGFVRVMYGLVARYEQLLIELQQPQQQPPAVASGVV